MLLSVIKEKLMVEPSFPELPFQLVLGLSTFISLCLVHPDLILSPHMEGFYLFVVFSFALLVLTVTAESCASGLHCPLSPLIALLLCAPHAKQCPVG